MRENMTFLEETQKAVEGSGHKTEDVMFIGSNDGKYRMTWEKFSKLANFEYDRGYGIQRIAIDLIIYFNDGSYITRGEYDGAEWWEYNTPKLFSMGDRYEDFDELGGDGYKETVEELIEASKLNSEDNDISTNI